MTHGGKWTFFQSFRSLAHTVWDQRCLEDLEEKDESGNEWVNLVITKVFVEQPRLHRVSYLCNIKLGWLGKKCWISKGLVCLQWNYFVQFLIVDIFIYSYNGGFQWETSKQNNKISSKKCFMIAKCNFETTMWKKTGNCYFCHVNIIKWSQKYA